MSGNSQTLPRRSGVLSKKAIPCKLFVRSDSDEGPQSRGKSPSGVILRDISRVRPVSFSKPSCCNKAPTTHSATATIHEGVEEEGVYEQAKQKPAAAAPAPMQTALAAPAAAAAKPVDEKIRNQISETVHKSESLPDLLVNLVPPHEILNPIEDELLPEFDFGDLDDADYLKEEEHYHQQQQQQQQQQQHYPYSNPSVVVVTTEMNVPQLEDNTLSVAVSNQESVIQELENVLRNLEDLPQISENVPNELENVVQDLRNIRDDLENLPRVPLHDFSSDAESVATQNSDNRLDDFEELPPPPSSFIQEGGTDSTGATRL